MAVTVSQRPLVFDDLDVFEYCSGILYNVPLFKLVDWGKVLWGRRPQR